ncbi:MAG: hypothetical protein DHS20C18_13650 [Saprospiraceae bacterium]|nr:MAG: hypothetical protein DHS20C18_13650 [Saprospiraceae bacterium]
MQCKLWVLALLCTTLNLSAQFVQGPDGFFYNLDGRLGQNINQISVSFLDIETNAANVGIANISVVAPKQSQQNSFSQNPALLARGLARWDAHLDFAPWLRNMEQGAPLLLDGGLVRTFGNRHAAGLRIRYFDLEGFQLGATEPFLNYEFSITGNYAYQISQKISLGVGLKYFDSAIQDIQPSAVLKPVRSIALDLGFHYQTEKEFTDGSKLHWNLGLAITNLGPKVSYVAHRAERLEYLPTALKAGTLFGWEKPLKNDRSLFLNVTYQASKLLTPSTQPFIDDNNDGVEDYRQFTALEGILKSFGDAPGGSKEEWWEITHRFGLESWMHWDKKFSTAVRGGCYYQHPYKGGQEYGTLGLSTKYQNLFLDLAYIYSIGKGATALDGTWVAGLGYRKVL